MSDLTTLHSSATKLILLLREGLERLETTEAAAANRGGEASTTTGSTKDIAADLRSKFNELQRVSTEMENIWRMQVIRENNSKRDTWKRKVERVAEELDSIRHSMARYGSREDRRQAEARDRNELFARAHDGLAAKREMDAEAQMMGSVARSKRYIEEMFDTGTNILSTMAGSRERLKAAQKKALDVLHSIGLGESLLKLIERRQRMDIYMAYGGMVVVLLVVCLVVWWAWF